jgi:cytochrome c biogenesis protein CcmG, thiol:disulfide interchange protein DsbE
LRGFIGPDYTIGQKHTGENVMNNIDESENGEAAPRRRGFRPAHIVLVAGLILLVIILVKQPPSAPATIGQMPTFSLINIAGGDLKSQDLQGKVVVVDFWASWCEPCKREIPQYNKIVDSMEGKDFQMIGYAVESGDIDDVRKSAAELGIQYQVVMGTDPVTQGFGNYRGLPTTFVIGKNGKIYKKYEGTSENKVAQVAKDVTELLAAPPNL